LRAGKIDSSSVSCVGQIGGGRHEERYSATLMQSWPGVDILCRVPKNITLQDLARFEWVLPHSARRVDGIEHMFADFDPNLTQASRHAPLNFRCDTLDKRPYQHRHPTETLLEMRIGFSRLSRLPRGKRDADGIATCELETHDGAKLRSRSPAPQCREKLPTRKSIPEFSGRTVSPARHRPATGKHFDDTRRWSTP